MNAQEAKATATGWLDTLKEKVKYDKWPVNRERLSEIALYVSVGFVVGFVVKKLSHYIWALVVAGLVIAGLSYLGLISIAINWANVDAFLGTQSVAAQASGNVGAALWAWVQANATVVISFAVGFWFGTSIA